MSNKMKITITMTEEQANWLLQVLESLTEHQGDEESQQRRFFKRIYKTVDRRMMPVAAETKRDG